MLISSKPTTPSAPSARATEPTGANSEGVDARLDKTESQLIARKVFQIEVAKPVRGDAAEKNVHYAEATKVQQIVASFIFSTAKRTVKVKGANEPKFCAKYVKTKPGK